MTPQDLIDAAHAQGRLAFKQTLRPDQNPYRSGDGQPLSQSFALSQAWKTGYVEAGGTLA